MAAGPYIILPLFLHCQWHTLGPRFYHYFCTVSGVPRAHRYATDSKGSREACAPGANLGGVENDLVFKKLDQPFSTS